MDAHHRGLRRQAQTILTRAGRAEYLPPLLAATVVHTILSRVQNRELAKRYLRGTANLLLSAADDEAYLTKLENDKNERPS